MKSDFLAVTVVKDIPLAFVYTEGFGGAFFSSTH